MIFNSTPKLKFKLKLIIDLLDKKVLHVDIHPIFTSQQNLLMRSLTFFNEIIIKLNILSAGDVGGRSWRTRWNSEPRMCLAIKWSLFSIIQGMLLYLSFSPRGSIGCPLHGPHLCVCHVSGESIRFSLLRAFSRINSRNSAAIHCT